MRNLVEGLSWASDWEKSWNVPTKASLCKARASLGPAPLAALFASVAQPLATEATKGAFYRPWRLMSIDGTSLDLADTPGNEERFGRLPPRDLDAAHVKAASEILSERLGPRRLRANPRVVKRKMSNFGVKRAEHRNWPQPTKASGQAVVILGARGNGIAPRPALPRPRGAGATAPR